MKTPRKVITGLTILLVAALLVVGLELTNTTHFFHTASKHGGINYGPPTATEKNDAESRKTHTPPISNNTAGTPTSNSTAKTSVSVEITTFNPKTSDNNVGVNGFVSNVVENGGTCTLTLTDANGKKVTGTHPGEANATNTTCGETTIPLSSLHSGTWQAVLSYSSNSSIGKSDPVAIKVN